MISMSCIQHDIAMYMYESSGSYFVRIEILTKPLMPNSLTPSLHLGDVSVRFLFSIIGMTCTCVGVMLQALVLVLRLPKLEYKSKYCVFKSCQCICDWTCTVFLYFPWRAVVEN